METIRIKQSNLLKKIVLPLIIYRRDMTIENVIFRTSFPGDHSRLEPPDPISNSEVKRTYADDSVGIPHAKVGNRQVFITKKATYIANKT